MDHTFGRIGFGRIMETCLRSVGRLDGGGFKLLCFARIKIMQGIFMHWKIFMRIVRSDNLRFSLFGSRFPNCERDIFFHLSWRCCQSFTNSVDLMICITFRDHDQTCSTISADHC